MWNVALTAIGTLRGLVKEYNRLFCLLRGISMKDGIKNQNPSYVPKIKVHSPN